MIYMKKRLANEKVGNGTSWSMDIEMEHFKVQQVHVNLIKKPQRIDNVNQNTHK